MRFCIFSNTFLFDYISDIDTWLPYNVKILFSYFFLVSCYLTQTVYLHIISLLPRIPLLSNICITNGQQRVQWFYRLLFLPPIHKHMYHIFLPWRRCKSINFPTIKTAMLSVLHCYFYWCIQPWLLQLKGRKKRNDLVLLQDTSSRQTSMIPHLMQECLQKKQLTNIKILTFILKKLYSTFLKI